MWSLRLKIRSIFYGRTKIENVSVCRGGGSNILVQAKSVKYTLIKSLKLQTLNHSII